MTSNGFQKTQLFLHTLGPVSGGRLSLSDQLVLHELGEWLLEDLKEQMEVGR